MKSVIRKVITAILRFTLRVFFRHIEVSGLEHVPARGGVIFVLNHPNALVDPAFLLCHAPRQVSFLAKAPLFKMPVIGYFVRALDSLPVYRRQDAGADTARNFETFAAARELLKRGGTIAICPEGVSHNEPRLLPLKSGAARIALGAASVPTENKSAPVDVQIVPAGLYYTAKTTFRSAALLRFGTPLQVESVALDEEGEPPRDAVRDLSDRISVALGELVLSASDKELWEKVMRAERVFSSGNRSSEEESLLQEFQLRRAFLEAYTFHHARIPARVARLEARIRRYEQQLTRAGIETEDFSHSSFSASSVARFVTTRLLVLLVLFPLAAFGIVVHYPAYRLAGLLARKFAREYDDMLSTIKVLAAMLLFPLTWMALAAFLFYSVGWRAAILSLALAPLAGYAAIRFLEKMDEFIVNARALGLYLVRRRSFHRLVKERSAIRHEIAALGEEAARENL